MAIMARGANQCLFYLAGSAWIATERFLGGREAGKLHLADSRDRCLFYWRLGTGLEMALFAGPHQADSYQEDLPHCNDWIYGKQCLSRSGR